MSVRRLSFILALTVALPFGAAAQLGLPGGGLPRIGSAVSATADGLGDLVDRATCTVDLDRLAALSPARAAQALVAARVDRLARFVRDNRAAVASDDRGDPAVRDVVLLTGASAGEIAAIQAADYATQVDSVEGLDIALVRVTVPEGAALSQTIRRLRKIAPGAQASSDTLYFQSGAAGVMAGGTLAAAAPATGGAIGMIDGGVAKHPAITGGISQRGFARGAPLGSAHGTAVASLIAGTGPIRGSAPGARLMIGDVYGGDPAGGGALAIARALGWMTAGGVRVVTISLVGPQNPLLGQAVRAAQAKGVLIVAAVGNDGPAAPPAYPASYPGVVAVTGVDGRNRALIEAGRASHLDYAAPGADMMAASGDGKTVRVRGTSFAAPLVAGLALRAGNVIRLLDAQAQDLGRKGTDAQFGRGLLCGACRNIP